MIPRVDFGDVRVQSAGFQLLEIGMVFFGFLLRGCLIHSKLQVLCVPFLWTDLSSH
jgi:hypothetical protein